MMIGARTAAWAKSGYTAKDYVQDGLVAMWDGIENAGWGSHSYEGMVNLITGESVSFTSGGEIREDCFFAPLLNESFGITLNIGRQLSLSDVSVEFVISTSGYGTANLGSFVFLNPWVDKVFEIYVFPKSTQPYWCIKYAGTEHRSITRYYSDGNRVSNSFRCKPHSAVFHYDGQQVLNYTKSVSHDSLDGFAFKNAGFIAELCNIRLYDRFISEDERKYNYAIDKARFGLT